MVLTVVLINKATLVKLKWPHLCAEMKQIERHKGGRPIKNRLQDVTSLSDLGIELLSSFKIAHELALVAKSI